MKIRVFFLSFACLIFTSLFSGKVNGKEMNLPDSLKARLQTLPEENRDTFLLNQAWNYYQLYTREGYLLALECNIAALHLAQKHDHKNAIINAYKGIGAVHDASNNVRGALKYYNLYYNGIKKRHNPYLTLRALYNLAATYGKAKDTTAFSYVPAMLEVIRGTKDNDLKDIGYLFLTNLYNGFGRYAKVIYYFEKLPENIDFDQISPDYGRLYSEVKSSYLIEKGAYEKALEPLKQELAVTKDSIPALLTLMNHCARMGDYKDAYYYHHILDDYNVRKSNAEIESTINYKLLSAENERKEYINEQLKLRGEQLKHNNLALYFVIQALVILLVVICYVFYKFRKQNKKVLEQNDFIKKQNEHIAVLLKEIHHRVKNNLQVISSLIELELVNPVKNPLDSLLQIQSKMGSFALAHQMMYESPDIEQISLQTYFEQMINTTLDILAVSHNRIEKKIEMGDAHLGPNRLVLLALMINELITNTCKHVLPYRPDCYIQLTCILKNNKMHITYTDSGGVSSHTDKPPGMGRRLIPKLAAQMNAQTKVREMKGKLEYTFIMDIADKAA